LLKGFQGNADTIKFCNTNYDLPAPVETLTDCLIDLNLRKKGINGKTITNAASNSINPRTRSQFDFKLTSEPEFDSRAVSTEVQTENLFDGIACKNDQNTLKLLSANSSLSFTTIELATNDLSVEFWFKFVSE
jgi:hypothetical protein